MGAHGHDAVGLQDFRRRRARPRRAADGRAPIDLDLVHPHAHHRRAQRPQRAPAVHAHAKGVQGGDGARDDALAGVERAPVVVRDADVRRGRGRQRVALFQRGPVGQGADVGDGAVGEAERERRDGEPDAAQPPILQHGLIRAERQHGRQRRGRHAGHSLPGRQAHGERAPHRDDDARRAERGGRRRHHVARHQAPVHHAQVGGVFEHGARGFRGGAAAGGGRGRRARARGRGRLEPRHPRPALGQRPGVRVGGVVVVRGVALGLGLARDAPDEAWRGGEGGGGRSAARRGPRVARPPPPVPRCSPRLPSRSWTRSTTS